MKRLIPLLIIFCIFTTSCSSMHEVDDFAYVIALGVDISEDGDYLFTYSFANSLSIGGGGGEEGGGGKSPSNSLLNITVKAKDVFEGINILNTNISKMVEMSHLKLIVFSKEIAKNGLGNHLDDFVLDMSVRPRIMLAISDISPNKYLDNLKMSFEVNPEKYLNDIFTDKSSPLVTRCTLFDFYNHTYLSNVIPLVTVDSVEEKSVISGICIFKKDKLKAVYTGYEPVYHNILKGNLKNTNYVLSTGENTVVYELTQENRPKVKVDTSSKNPVIRIEIPLDCRIKSRTSDNLNFKELLEKDLTHKTKEYLYKSAKTLETDVMRYEKIAKRKFLTTKKFNEYNWEENYRMASFDIMITADIQTD